MANTNNHNCHICSQEKLLRDPSIPATITSGNSWTWIHLSLVPSNGLRRSIIPSQQRTRTVVVVAETIWEKRQNCFIWSMVQGLSVGFTLFWDVISARQEVDDGFCLWFGAGFALFGDVISAGHEVDDGFGIGFTLLSSVTGAFDEM